MKTRLAIMACAAALLAGCAGVQNPEPPSAEECAQVAEKYNALMDRLAAGNVISPDDVERGRLWADILTLSCGWNATRAQIQGVPVVKPHP
jgi:hypothetical protein